MLAPGERCRPAGGTCQIGGLARGGVSEQVTLEQDVRGPWALGKAVPADTACSKALGSRVPGIEGAAGGPWLEQRAQWVW